MLDVSYRYRDSRTHLLRHLAIVKQVVQVDFKLSHVILAKAVLVPADTRQDGRLEATQWHLERDVPFRVEGLWDNLCRESVVSQGENEELDSISASEPGELHCKTYRVAEAVAVLCSEISSLEQWLVRIVCGRGSISRP